MRERAFTTSIIWIALAISIDRILASLRYSEVVQSPIDSTQLVSQVAFVSTGWQIGAGILIFALTMAAMGVTITIWQNVNGKADQITQQSQKAKRDNRDARIKRLLATMDDDDLDALERGGIDAEGERLSLEALLRKRD